MADGHTTVERRKVVAVEDLGHQPLALDRREAALLGTDDAARLLAAVLQGMKAVVDDSRRIVHAEDAKDAVLPSEGTADAKQSTLTGTISDIKDFMFTITADGTDYEFSFEQDQKPDGLSDVKDGDKVTVTYTGTVSEVDAFSGTVLSVKKAE
jgi:hypothetical protein